MNIFQLKKRFKVKQLDTLKLNYTERKGKVDYDLVYAELDRLLQRYRKAKSSSIPEGWTEMFMDWKNRMLKVVEKKKVGS
ncbi:hypothetical protein ES708_29492 [subsurface metagenome]